MPETRKYETQFFSALRDIFVGAKIEGDSGYINLMRIKSRYYEQGVFPLLKRDIDKALQPFPDFREELFDKLYTFFQRYFSESGSIYFRYTSLHQNVYEKVYTDDRDVMLFWKTHMLYYVKTDRIFNSLAVEVDGFKFFFDASSMELKRSNEKRETIYTFRSLNDDGALVFDVTYSERGRTTKMDEILKALRQTGQHLTDDTLTRAFRVFEKQSEVDYFINKNACAFLQEQFDLWMYQYLFAGHNIWSEDRLAQLQVLKEIAFKTIDFISQFEDELVRIWNKPKFVRNSHYIITLDHIMRDEELLKRILARPNMPDQVQEWQDLGFLPTDFRLEMITQRDLAGDLVYPQYQFLSLDTKHFPDLELDILALFDDLDASLDGWLIHSENYQALNSSKPKFFLKVKSIYIDPPYNTAASEINYVNKYKHASWISMMHDRISVSKEFLNIDNGSFCCTIDDVEQKNLSQIIENIFSGISGTVAIQIKPSGRPIPNGFAISHEYAIFANVNPSFPIARLDHSISQTTRYKENDELGSFFWEMLRKAGSNSRKEDRPTMYYPFYFNRFSKKIRLPKLEWNVSESQYSILENYKEDEVAIYPKKDDGSEGCWYFGIDRAKVMVNQIKAELRKNGEYWLYYKRRPNEGVQPLTIWNDSKYSATEHGTALLKNLFGLNSTFTYPKSLYAVKDCLLVTRSIDQKNGIYLDYFAGSGTTAHAVIQLNNDDGGKRKYLLIEMGDYFHTVIIPRVKKVSFSGKWRNGKPILDKGTSQFVKYFDFEQYEDTLKKSVYRDTDLFNNPYEDPFHSYIFLRDEKMLSALDVDTANNAVHVHPERLYPDIDLAETISQRRGKWIKRITHEYVEFQDGEKQNLIDPDWQVLKPLIWW